MAVFNNRIGKKTATYVQTNRHGMFTSTGPFIGIVKDNIDQTCAGRLRVYIPTIGSPKEDDPTSWYTVSYASPFRGQTRGTQADIERKITNLDDPSENSFQSYGFWMVPPDLNCRVICFFVGGDPRQGYWMACVGDSKDARMTPGIGSVQAGTSATGGYLWKPEELKTHQYLRKYIELNINGAKEIPFRLPVSEAVLDEQQDPSNLVNPSGMTQVPHVYQSYRLGLQGLCFDFSRGSTSSSSVRESPSQVYGFSSPGRLRGMEDVQASKKIFNAIDANSNAELEVLKNNYRTGGHQIVLDDGTLDGLDQGIRIKTTKGHTILLDDTNEQIYIVNSTGTAWIEITPSGRIDVFSNGDFSVRSKGDINFQSDKDINLHAKQDVNIKSEKKIKVESDSDLTINSHSSLTEYASDGLNIGTASTLALSSQSTASMNSNSDVVINGSMTYINTKSGKQVQAPAEIKKNKHIETGLVPNSNVWWQSGTYKSIVSRAPAHEPWVSKTDGIGHEIDTVKTYKVEKGSGANEVINRSSSSVSEGTVATAPTPSDGVAGLTKDQTKALMTTIGKAESGNNYAATNQLGYTGKYQFGAEALEDTGYLKPGTVANAKASGYKNVNTAMQDPSNWTGKNGVSSLEDWKKSGSAQESAMEESLNHNVKYMKAAGVDITKLSAEEQAGYLGAAQLGGASNAVNLYKYNTGQGGSNFADANGTTSLAYYNLCKKAGTLGSSIAKA